MQQNDKSVVTECGSVDFVCEDKNLRVCVTRTSTALTLLAI